MDTIKTPLMKVITHYRGNRTLRNFAEVISEEIPKPIPFQSIWMWERGISQPSYHVFLPVALHYNDWRRDFALDCMATLKPDVYPPATSIAFQKETGK